MPPQQWPLHHQQQPLEAKSGHKSGLGGCENHQNVLQNIWTPETAGKCATKGVVDEASQLSRLHCDLTKVKPDFISP